jgi:hypothetical protein
VLVRLLTSIMPKVLLPSTDQFGRIFSAQVWNWCSVCAVTSQRQSCPSADLFIPQEYDPHHALYSRVAGCRTGRHSSDRNLQCILFVLGCLLYEWVNDKQHLLWLYVCILEGEPLVHVIAFRHSYWWKERKKLTTVWLSVRGELNALAVWSLMSHAFTDALCWCSVLRDK